MLHTRAKLPPVSSENPPLSTYYQIYFQMGWKRVFLGVTLQLKVNEFVKIN